MFSRKEWLLLFSMAFIQFSHTVDFMIVMPLGPQLMRTFNIDPHQFGLIVSCYTLSAGFSGLIAFLYIDRFDRKKSLLFYYVGFCLSTIACALSPNYTALLVSRIFSGAFGGVLASMTMSIVGDSIPPEKRGSAMGVVSTSFSLASIMGIPLSLFLAQNFNWHAPFLFLGGLSLCLIVLIIISIPEMQQHLQTYRNSPKEQIKQTFRNSNLNYALAFAFTLVMGHFFIIPFLSPSFVINAGLDEKNLFWIYLVGGLFSGFFAPIVGRLSDQLGKRIVFVFGLVLSTIPMLIITHIKEPQSLSFILPLTAFFFITMGSRMIPAMAMITCTVSTKQRGGFMSLVTSLQQFGSAISSYLAGVIVYKTPAGFLANYNIVGYCAIIMSVFSLILVFKIKPAEGKF